MQTIELDLTGLTADIVSAYVAHNALTDDKLPDLIGSVYGALSRASLQSVEPEKVELKPAVAIKKSVTPDYIVCLEDGKKFKSLKRHLRTTTTCPPKNTARSGGCRTIIPWSLPSYAAVRSDLAKNMGLGRRGYSGSGRSTRSAR